MRTIKTSIDTHSDSVRARRQQAVKNRTTRVSQYTRKESVNRPPVTVRTNFGSGMAIRSNAGRNNRQFAFSVGTSNMKLGASPFGGFKPSWRILSAILTVFFGCILVLMTNMDQFKVTQPKLIGFERITPTDLSAVINLTGQSIYEVDAEAVSKSLSAAFPELLNISVRIGFPANVIIDVKERKPVMQWQTEDTNLWVDAEGYIFAPRGTAETALTVLADTNPPLQLVDEEEKDETTPAHPLMDLKVLKAAMDLSYRLGTGASVLYTKSNGLGWADPKGWRVFVGSNLESLDTKVTMYNSLVNQLAEQGKQPTVVSLEFVDVPYYHLEQ